MKVKIKNGKNGVTSTVNLALHIDLMSDIENTKERSQIRMMEVKKVTYGETL